MRDSHWFRRLEIALEFDSGFEIFLLLGRGELARPALARIAEELRRFGAPHWHHLHLDGLDGLLAEDQPEGVLHLVHGFERMTDSAAADMAARLNVNRDRLEVLRGPVIFWIPEDFYEELLRQAPDFVAWRSQASVVPDAELGFSSEVLAEEFCLCQTLRAAEEALREVPPLDVLDSGVRKPILEWLGEGNARSLCYEPRDSPLGVMSWCAGQLARRRDAGDYDKVPILLPSVLLALAERGDLADGVARLWREDALHIVVLAAVSAAERDALVARADGNRVLVVLHDASSECVAIAPLSGQQIRFVIDHSLSDLGPQATELWQGEMAKTVRYLASRAEHLGVLADVVRDWRGRGLSGVTWLLQKRGWREHAFWLIEQQHVHVAPSAFAVRLGSVLEVLARPDVVQLARSLYEVGSRDSSESKLSLLDASIALYRANRRVGTGPGLVDALIARARLAEDENEIPIWTEAVSAARDLEPGNSGLLVEALDGLGFAQHLAGHEREAELAVQEALSLAREAGLSSGLLAQLHVTLAYSLRGQDRFEEALATAERALAEVQADEMVQVELLEICDEACESLGMKERALEFAARRLEVRRRLRVGSPTLWWELQIFAQRLLDGGKPEEALRLAHEIIALLSSTNEGLSYQGQAYPFVFLAEIYRMLDDREHAIAAMRDAIQVYREVIADGGPWWSTTELAGALISLSGDLAQADAQEEALNGMLEAVNILENVEWSSYPADLAAALTQLGEYAAAKKMYPLATAAYARILALAEPFPARTSEPVLEIERRLVALCKDSGIPLDDALARGQRPITVET